MECSGKSARVEFVLAVRHAQLNSLSHVFLAVVAGRKGEQMLALASLGLFQRVGSREQRGGLASVGKVAEESLGISVDAGDEDLLEGDDPRNVVLAKTDASSAPLDIVLRRRHGKRR